MDDEAGEVVGHRRQQPRFARERFDVGDRLRDDEHLALVGAAALQQRECLV